MVSRLPGQHTAPATETIFPITMNPAVIVVYYSGFMVDRYGNAGGVLLYYGGELLLQDRASIF